MRIEPTTTVTFTGRRCTPDLQLRYVNYEKYIHKYMNGIAFHTPSETKALNIRVSQAVRIVPSL